MLATGVVVTSLATASMFPVCTGALVVPSDTLTSWSSISVLDWYILGLPRSTR